MSKLKRFGNIICQKKIISKVILIIITATISMPNLKAVVIDGKQHAVFRLGTEQGLLHPKVNVMKSDSEGFVWLGTHTGIQRYDGIRLKCYPFGNNNSGTVTNEIFDIAVYTNYLYAAYNGGIIRIDTKTNKLKRINNYGKFNNLIYSLSVSKNGIIWGLSNNSIISAQQIGTTDSFRIDDFANCFEPTKVESTLRLYKILSAKGYLWLGSNKGLFFAPEPKNGKIDRTVIFENISANPPKSAQIKDFVIKDSTLILLNPIQLQIYSIKTNKGNVSIRYIKTVPIFNLLSPEVKKTVSAKINCRKITIDKDNRIWITTWGGLYLIENIMAETPKATIFRYSPFDENSINSDISASVFLDYSGNVWVSTFNSGINIIQRNPEMIQKIKYNPYLPDISLSTNAITTLETDYKNNIWVGTQGFGINVFDAQKTKIATYTTTAKSKFNISNDQINSLSCFGDTIIFATPASIEIINRKLDRITTVNRNQFEPIYQNINRLILDKLGRLWVSTSLNGLYCIEPPFESGAIIHYDAKNRNRYTLCSNIIKTAEYSKSHNKLLIGTNRGLNIIHLDRQNDTDHVSKLVPDPNMLSKRNEISFLSCQNDSVWFCASYYGFIYKLNIINENKLKPIEIQQNTIPYIETFLCDTIGNFWISNNNICHIVKSKPGDDFIVHKMFPSTANFVKMANNNELIYGGSNGIVYFNINQKLQSNDTPRIAITNFEHIGNEQTNQTANNIEDALIKVDAFHHQKFKHYENDFRIEFSTLNYGGFNKSTYKLRLDGLTEKDHYTITDIAHVDYLNLKPGKYRFEVKSISEAGIESPEAVIEFEIAYPWWRSSLAILGYLILFASVFFIVLKSFRRWIALKNRLKVEEEVHQAKMKFFTEISHEFRTPLTLIIDPVDRILSENIQNKLAERYLPLIKKNATKLLNLVNEILEFRKIETGNQHVVKKHQNIKPITQSIANEFLLKAELHNIAFDYQEVGDLDDAYADIDGQKFEIILNNLLSNAFKFAASQVTLRIARNKTTSNRNYANKIVLTNRKTSFDSIVEISVENDGQGMSQVILQRIFEPYFQAETAQKTLGTGLGLALTKQLILLHNAELEVESEPDKGTIFRISVLQISEGETLMNTLGNGTTNNLISNNIPVSNQESTDKPSNLPKLLIVEDNIDIQLYLKSELEHDFNIVLAANGLIGKDLCHKEMPDVIISDIMMPVMNGIEFCKSIKSDLNTSHIPVIMLTSLTSSANTIEALEEGADIYLSKPFAIDVLTAHLHSLLKNRMLIKSQILNAAGSLPLKLNITITDRKFLDKALCCIAKHIEDENFNVETLSAELAMTSRNLQKKINALTGETPLNFIRNQRLFHAKQLIEETECNFSEIAFKTGFSSEIHFRKCFKQKFGFPPSQAKPKNRN